jgi:predicted ABC-type ATPase
MKSRHEIHAELEQMVARGEAALERLKGRVGAAGHEVSAEVKDYFA